MRMRHVGATGIVASPVRGRRLFSIVVLGALGALAGALASGCGGSEQNAGEVKRSYPVQIVRASFPARQSVPRVAHMVLTVHNPGVRTIPNVAVTVDSFSYTNAYKEEASRKQPVWIVDEGPGSVPKRPVQSQSVDPPGSGQTAYVNTWALGALRAHATETFVWRVTPVKSGVHHVDFIVAAGLAGNARAHLSTHARAGEGSLGNGVVVAGAGGAPVGHFTVAIASSPPPRHVNPETGAVTPGPYVPSAGT
jgi:hypothetical protein